MDPLPISQYHAQNLPNVLVISPLFWTFLGNSKNFLRTEQCREQNRTLKVVGTGSKGFFSWQVQVWQVHREEVAQIIY